MAFNWCLSKKSERTIARVANKHPREHLQWNDLPRTCRWNKHNHKEEEQREKIKREGKHKTAEAFPTGFLLSAPIDRYSYHKVLPEQGAFGPRAACLLP